MCGIIELGRHSVNSFFEHRMAIYAEQPFYRCIFGFFPFIILVFALLAVLRIDVVFDWLVEAATTDKPAEEALEELKKKVEGQEQQGARRRGRRPTRLGADSRKSRKPRKRSWQNVNRP